MAKVYIETYGCTSNQADSDIMRGLIAKEFTLSSIDDADVVVINSCGVVEYTERKILRRVQELKSSGKRVILAGCLPRIAGIKDSIADSIVSPDNIDRISDAVRNVLEGKNVVFDERRKVDKSEFRCVKCRLRENAIAIVSISEGCLGKCSYCATRFARGRLKSFKPENIVDEVRLAVESGFKEIQLTSQDTSAYGRDMNTNLAELLMMISEIDGEFRVRVGMMNPNHMLDILEDLIYSFKSEKIFKFFHIPVQSGSDAVLRRMNREYTVEEFEEIIVKLRKEFEDIVLSTDIIVGYPQEGLEEFMESYRLLERIKPDIVNITRFSSRKGTPASKLRDIPDWIKKERSRKLTELVYRIGKENNSRHVGKRYTVLVTKKGKGNTFLARTDSYRPVIVEDVEIGNFYSVFVEDCTFNYLKGKKISKKD
ncbi:tRNA (N(6)-L-threonylcarbamoyladenosine(37)-C(2))-methylthiotransferase [Archaeoglobus sulfaticallidus]|nr:tRNA (N(6)-L-threonylcarbamoyladenosine(37)-C(2))-methylthiotransferase [Archaeoglobus sulfaticallidus]